MTQFATKQQVSRGDVLVADGSFDCIKRGSELKVQEGRRALYVDCAQGKHFIGAQLDDQGRYVGFSLKPRQS